MNRSLQVRLSLWLSVAILGVGLAAGAFAFVSAFREANELQDDQLRQMAALVNRQSLSEPKTPTAVPISDPDSRIMVQRLPEGPAAESGGEAPAIPPGLVEGFQTLRIEGVYWRVYVRRLDAGGRVAVGQQTAVRDEIAQDGAWHTITPFLVLAPMMLALIGLLVGQMFRPVRQLAAELDQRAEQDMGVLDDRDVPTEIRPFVVAINRLLERIAGGISLQRRFLADAAHELRTPLAALSLQMERLDSSEMSIEARDRLAALHAGLQRTRGVVDQLLAMARVQEGVAGQAVPVSLHRVFRRVLEDLLPLAEAKRIDIGMSGEQDAQIEATEMDLMMLVRNLVENAIRYTPESGRIDLAIATGDGSVGLSVTDSGPGIPEGEYARVFDPFYRVAGNDQIGSGLGLSIVKTIADRLQAEVTLSPASNRLYLPGLRVQVAFSGGARPGICFNENISHHRYS